MLRAQMRFSSQVEYPAWRNRANAALNVLAIAKVGEMQMHLRAEWAQAL